MLIVGALFYFSVLLIELGIGPRILVVADLVLVLFAESTFFVLIVSVIGRQENSRQLVALAAGLVIPIALIGVISEARFPLILFVDIAYGLFIWKLWRMYGQRENSTDSWSASRIT